jgi:hypothetical protein
MSDTVVDGLIVDLLNWLEIRERGYEEVMDAWRTSCPKLPVWEDANDRGFIAIDAIAQTRIIRITNLGREFLAAHRDTC